MSGYIKVPNCDRDWDFRKKDCDCSKKEIIIIEKDRDFKKDCGCAPCKVHPKQRGVIWACGKQGNTIRVDSDIMPSDPPVEIARVTIDPSILCNPLVIIEFCSIIFSPSDILTEFTIALSKECQKITKREVKRVMFRRPPELGNTTDSFCFKFCDFNNNCTGGCCSYIVELVEATVTFTGSTISQGVVTSQVQGSCVDC